MTDEKCEIFGDFEGEFLKFENVDPKFSQYKDLHAFILLEKIAPSMKPYQMVCSAEHDQIWLDVNLDRVRNATKAQLLDLHRCGVIYDKEVESLSMYR